MVTLSEARRDPRSGVMTIVCEMMRSVPSLESRIFVSQLRNSVPGINVWGRIRVACGNIKSCPLKL